MKANLRKRVTRQGLTLIELVIVLAILAALAGLVLPLAGTYLEKAHAGAAASNFKEVAKVVGQHNAVTRNYFDGLDSLTDGTDIGPLPGAVADGVFDPITVVGLTTPQANALQAVGINNLADFGGPGESVTFDGTVAPTPVAAGRQVAQIDELAVEPILGLDPGNTETNAYLIFGLGHQTVEIGEWFQEAPFHFPEAGNPNEQYERFGLVFDLTEATGPEPEPAKFVGVVSFHPDEVKGPREPLGEFFEG